MAPLSDQLADRALARFAAAVPASMDVADLLRFAAHLDELAVGDFVDGHLEQAARMEGKALACRVAAVQRGSDDPMALAMARGMRSAILVRLKAAAMHSATAACGGWELAVSRAVGELSADEAVGLVDEFAAAGALLVRDPGRDGHRHVTRRCADGHVVSAHLERVVGYWRPDPEELKAGHWRRAARPCPLACSKPTSTAETHAATGADHG